MSPDSEKHNPPFPGTTLPSIGGHPASVSASTASTAASPPTKTDTFASHRDRQHDTQVCEEVEPAVTKETVAPVEEVKETVAVDREVHQDHHQTRIQPVEDHVRAPEKHEHHIVPVAHREAHHNKDNEIKKKLEAEVSSSSMSSLRLY
jgi:hypothetical protein